MKQAVEAKQLDYLVGKLIDIITENVNTSKEYINEQIENLIDNSDIDLNSIKELSDALQNDKDFAINIKKLIDEKVDKVEGKGLSTNDFTDEAKNMLDAVINAQDTLVTYTMLEEAINNLNNNINEKVDKVEDKGLSTNDFTNEYVDKLDSVENGAQVNVLESVSVNNTALTITDKNVNINMGEMALKDSISESDLDSDLTTKINDKADYSELPEIAKTGNINNIVQTAGDLLIIDCGSASVNI